MIKPDQLVQRLREARDAYYNAQPKMSDAAFDALEDELRRLDPKHAYFSEVGAAPADGWNKAKHGQPMGSLDKAQNEAEMQAWHTSTGLHKGDGVLIMDKLDGASISLHYVKGRLKQAVTRGDGLVGDDITRNVKLMKGVPTDAKGFTGFVRGEVVCLRTDFVRHFKNEGYSNPRNTANGIMKRQDDPEPCRHLSVICYELSPSDGIMPSKKGELERLRELGFKTPIAALCLGAAAVQQMYNSYVDNMRGELDYDIDGLVLYVDDYQKRLELGEHNMRPKGTIAYKFPHDEKQTVLRAVDWQVGPSGRITPVGKFDPVELSGAQVKQASLHNPSYIERLVEHRASKLRVGDVVLVSRRNDVIPYIEELVTSGGGDVIDPPHQCPSCSEPTMRQGEYLVCTSPVCPAQVSGAIKRWVNKLDVKDFGEALIDALCASGMVSTVADLYTLDEKRVAKLEFESGRVCGLATAKLALKNLRAKTELPLDVLVGSLGIPLWGRSMVKLLVEAGYDTLDKLRKAKASQLAAVDKVGDTKALAFCDGIELSWPVVEALLANGVTVAKPATGHLKGTTMCMTGFRDGALAAAFEAAGGSVKGSVGRGLTYLVAADPKGGSGKLDKARELGTKVIGRDEMWAIVNG